jgi:hypothetical protein
MPCKANSFRWSTLTARKILRTGMPNIALLFSFSTFCSETQNPSVIHLHLRTPATRGFVPGALAEPAGNANEEEKRRRRKRSGWGHGCHADTQLAPDTLFFLRTLICWCQSIATCLEHSVWKHCWAEMQVSITAKRTEVKFFFSSMPATPSTFTQPALFWVIQSAISAACSVSPLAPLGKTAMSRGAWL